MGQKKKLQWVWPKDGRQGRRPRGFYGGLRDIIQNKGPDMFLQEKGNGAIPLDHWSNWDSYHHPVYHQHEEEGSHLNGLFGASRGNQRYDPNTRRYTEWSIDRDWWGERINDENQAFYPRFTQDESQRILRRLQRHKNITPRSMGSEWKTDGPKRFHPKYDWFWQGAHRVGENYREGFPLWAGINQNLRMRQGFHGELDSWIMDEPWHLNW